MATLIKAKNGKNRNGSDENTRIIPRTLPILPLRDIVVYPLTFMPIMVEDKRSIALVDAVVNDQGRLIGLSAVKDGAPQDPGPDQICSIGTAAVIHRLFRLPDDSVRIVVQGIDRIRIGEYISTDPYLQAKIEVSPEVNEKTVQVDALMHNTIELTRRLVSLVPYLPDELLMAAINTTDPRQLVYLIAGALRVEMHDRQELLELDTIEEKLRKLNTLVTKELEVLELGKKIQTQTQGELEKNQREYILREQLRQIQKELGEGPEAVEMQEYEKKIVDAHMSAEAEKEARRELNRIKSMPAASAEFHLIKTYIEWLVELPWDKATDDDLDISRARRILDEDHYDLKDVKERLLEYLAVRKLRLDRGEKDTAGERHGSILCFVGPPGVGKTSLGQSIARALGRKFIRMSLGGMHDEAEIRGHRRTYIGALPGRIIQSIRRAESRNPVMMLDEIDKVGADYRGDPSSALLEVLDPAQNRTFRDHFLDVDFDLSQVIFICTANQLDPIQPALRDRMEIMQLSGYTEEEKTKIAKGYLIPRQVAENGLRPGEIDFQDEAIGRIIRDHTREAGVRNLEREIGRVCRKIATQIAESKQAPAVIATDTVAELLGKPKFYAEVAERTTMPGVATGLAWTPAGGDILFIEATRMPGAKGFIVTGQLGDVMKESAQAALSYVRSNAEILGIENKLFQKSDIHLHIPEGATPKDGPSAGVTMATAIASLMMNRTVKNNLAMTGEITLRGRVLPVGGIKEKAIAAHRAGLTMMILPKRNEKDLDDLPEQVRREMKFVFVEYVKEVFDAALEPARAAPAHPAA
jgi:ATP-dependent Lon protease